MSRQTTGRQSRLAVKRARGIGMQYREWTRTAHHTRLDIGLLQAFYVGHTFPRHSHDYYVLCLVKRGLQSFTHRGTKHFTPPGGVILLNPGDVHTGEAADELGFEMECIYPTVSHMQAAVSELTGRYGALPCFMDVRVDHPWAAKSILGLYETLAQGTSTLECESHLTWTLTQFIKRFADTRHKEKEPGRERRAIRLARRYIEEHFAEGISLSELAGHVGLSPYYLLRVFRAEVGMPPHTYLDNVRIRHAQRLIGEGRSLAYVAAEVGFSSQSHLTCRFKQIIGVTPGRYAQQIG